MNMGGACIAQRRNGRSLFPSIRLHLLVENSAHSKESNDVPIRTWKTCGGKVVSQRGSDHFAIAASRKHPNGAKPLIKTYVKEASIHPVHILQGEEFILGFTIPASCID